MTFAMGGILHAGSWHGTTFWTRQDPLEASEGHLEPVCIHRSPRPHHWEDSVGVSCGCYRKWKAWDYTDILSYSLQDQSPQSLAGWDQGVGQLVSLGLRGESLPVFSFRGTCVPRLPAPPSNSELVTPTSAFILRSASLRWPWARQLPRTSSVLQTP